MCVALPGLVVSVGTAEGIALPAEVRFGDTVAEVDLALVPRAGVGDWVVVHSGYAIAMVPAETTLETRELLEAERYDRVTS